MVDCFSKPECITTLRSSQHLGFSGSLINMIHNGWKSLWKDVLCIFASRTLCFPESSNQELQCPLKFYLMNKYAFGHKFESLDLSFKNHAYYYYFGKFLIVKDSEIWCAVVHGVTKSWTWLCDWPTIVDLQYYISFRYTT